MRSTASRLLLISVLTACTTAPSVDAGPVDAAEPPDAPPPPVCAVDLSCPDRLPEAGAFCEGALNCSYEVTLCTFRARADCAMGRWQVTQPPLDQCAVPPPPPTGERCSTPFSGTRAGTVGVRFQGDRMIRGTQGTPMIPLEITLDGAASDLTCVGVTLALTVDRVVQAVPSGIQLRLRCGATTGYQVLVSNGVSSDGSYPIELTVTVAGVGSTMLSGTLGGPAF